jgi:hypothetical protein
MSNFQLGQYFGILAERIPAALTGAICGLLLLAGGIIMLGKMAALRYNTPHGV